jgi:hypothetical protein
MKKLIGGGLAALAIGLGLGIAPVAQADIDCTTSRMSGMSFTICRYSDPWRPATTTTCFDNSGHCTTREG